MSLLRLLLLLALGGCIAGQPKNNLVDEAEVAERATALGVAYLQQGDLVRAKENLLKALSVDKRSARAHHTLAIVFQQEQEFDLAEDYFKRAIGLDESLTATRNNYGAFLYAMGRPQEAVLELIRATEDRFYELRPQAFENLGVAYLALEDRAKAREAFDRGLALNPRLPRALIELAVLEVAEQNFSAARQHYLAYQGLAGDSPKSLSVCVTVNTVFKAYDAAGQCRADLLRIYPASEEAIRLAAEAERGDR
jgi:type IV pilus assembly protein PilF